MRTNHLSILPLLLIPTTQSPAQGGAFSPPRIEPGLAAGASAEADPAATLDKRTLVFASARPGGAGALDLWLATRNDPSADWASVSALPGSGLATPFDEFAPALDPTGTWLVFASSRPGAAGGTNLWLTTRSDGTAPFAPSQPLAGVNSPANETDPAVSTDCLELFYVSDLPLGAPGRRLWRATRASTAVPFGNAAPVTELDGPGEEVSPSLSRDGLTLFFCADRGNGFDVFSATRRDVLAPFRAAQLVTSLSTPADDLGVSLCFDDWTAYVSHVVAGTQRIVRADRVLPQVEDLAGGLELGLPWQVWTRAPQGTLAFLFMAPLAIPPLVIPGFGGALELDPATFLFLHAGVCDTSERSIAHLTIPNNEHLVGAELHFQALTDQATDLSLRKFSKRLKRAVERLVDKLQRCVDELRQCTRACANELPATIQRCARNELYMLYWGPAAYAEAVATCTQSAVQACLTSCAWQFARCALR